MTPEGQGTLGRLDLLQEEILEIQKQAVPVLQSEKTPGKSSLFKKLG